MILKKWDDLPDALKSEEVRVYYDILSNKKGSLVLKRIFDIVGSTILLVLLSPLFLVLAIAVKMDSKGPVFFKQIRVTQYGREFRIFKFRTMVNNAEKMGSQVTVVNDSRVTKIGKFLRKYRLDEIAQLINVLIGDMSFVGTRPEVPKYVAAYTNEMLATLLLPAGVTSEASVEFKDEEKMLNGKGNTDAVYIHKILPDKMKYNQEYTKKFKLNFDFQIVMKTLKAMVR